MIPKLDLKLKYRAMLEELFQQYLPEIEVWAYGSRTNGRSHDGSDLDLALRSPDLSPIDPERLSTFIEAYRESNIPFLVEARDWAQLPCYFHDEIERHHAVLIGKQKP